MDTAINNTISMSPDDAGDYISFDEICRLELTGTLEEALRCGISAKTVPLGSPSRTVAEPDKAEVAHFEVVSFRFYYDYDRPPVRVKVAAVIKTRLHLEETLGSRHLEDTADQWYQIECHATIKDGAASFSQPDLITLYDKDFQENLIQLDEYLVPIMRYNDLDRIARWFLERHFPEAVSSGVRISAKTIAERLELDIECVRLTRSGTLIGEILFNGGTINAFDDDLSPITVSFSRPTILIDYDAGCRCSAGRHSSSILHECVHYVLNLPFYELQRIKNRSLCGFSCASHRRDDGSGHGPVYWIEKRTCQLVPRIMMFSDSINATAERILDAVRSRYPKIGRLGVYEKAIPLIADHYGTSVMSTKIRMVEIGYEDSRGVQEYSGGKLVPAYEVSRKNGTQTDPSLVYTLTLEEAGIEAERNESFRKTLFDGDFVYAESHLCLNDERYVRTNSKGRLELTPRARHHIDECCLAFRPEPSQMDYTYVEGILCNDRKYSIYAKKYAKKCQEAAVNRIVDYATHLSEVSEIMPGLPPSFSGTVKAHMDRLKITKEDLAEVTHVSDSTIKRLRNDKYSRVKKEHVLVLGFGMMLYPEFIEDLMHKSGNLLNSQMPDVVYKFLVWMGYDKGMAFCNNTLVEHGLKPLTDVVEYC